MSTMNQFMIFKGIENTDEDTEYYNRRISEFSEKIVNEKSKGKRVLIITGSGISQNVPGMNWMSICFFRHLRVTLIRFLHNGDQRLMPI